MYKKHIFWGFLSFDAHWAVQMVSDETVHWQRVQEPRACKNKLQLSFVTLWKYSLWKSEPSRERILAVHLAAEHCMQGPVASKVSHLGIKHEGSCSPCCPLVACTWISCTPKALQLYLTGQTSERCGTQVVKSLLQPNVLIIMTTLAW